MAERLLPLFPLQLVLLPRMLLPLHIFEARYKEMMGECIDQGETFGILQATERGVVNIGCTASIDQVLRKHEDGRLDIQVVGEDRFEVLRLDESREFLRGEVRYFDDELGAPIDHELRQRVLAQYEKVRKSDEGIELPILDEDEDDLSFLICLAIPDLSVRQMMLALRSENERLERLAIEIPNFLDRQVRTVQVKKVAPKNGHSKWPEGLEKP
jgi:Lon protease-like protein